MGFCTLEHPKLQKFQSVCMHGAPDWAGTPHGMVWKQSKGGTLALEPRNPTCILPESDLASDQIPLKQTASLTEWHIACTGAHCSRVFTGYQHAACDSAPHCVGHSVGTMFGTAQNPQMSARVEAIGTV